MGERGKENEDDERRAKYQFLVYLNGVAKLIPLLFLTQKTETLIPIIRRKVVPDSIVYTDSYRSYNVLDVSEFHHEQINHTERFVDNRNHIKGISFY